MHLTIGDGEVRVLQLISRTSRQEWCVSGQPLSAQELQKRKAVWKKSLNLRRTIQKKKYEEHEGQEEDWHFYQDAWGLLNMDDSFVKLYTRTLKEGGLCERYAKVRCRGMQDKAWNTRISQEVAGRHWRFPVPKVGDAAMTDARYTTLRGRRLV